MESFPVLIVIILTTGQTLGKLLIHVDDPNFKLDNSSKQKLDDRFMALIATIPSGLKHDTPEYFRGLSIVDTLQSDQEFIVLHLYFYNAEACGKNYNAQPDVLTENILRQGFESMMPDLRRLMNMSYGAGYVAANQLQAGYYIKGMNVKGSNRCTTPQMNIVDDGSGYCYGYNSSLLGNSMFDTLYEGCQLKSLSNGRYVLEMQSDCSVTYKDTGNSNALLWTSGTRGLGSHCFLVLEGAKLVIHDGQSRSPVWTSNSTLTSNTSVFNVQGDGNMVVYTINAMVSITSWSSHTWQGDKARAGTPPFTPETKSTSTAIVVGSVIGALAVTCLTILTFTLLQKRKRHEKKEDDWVPVGSQAERYSYEELSVATNGFCKVNLIGEGGFARVYKGTSDPARRAECKVVAIKYLKETALSKEGNASFVNEVSTLCSLQHRNVVKLFGFCAEGDKRLLVCEYMKNNNLHEALLNNKLDLNWRHRFNICVGVARGIAYLHEETSFEATIIHRDIKASNILLDGELQPRVSDFGLARLVQQDKSHVSTRAAGTFGYVAPEYALSGQLSKKADVYSYGILVLEIVSGRRNMDFSLPTDEVFLLEKAWELYKKKELINVLDARLSVDMMNETECGEVNRVLTTALHCTQANASKRPTMYRVISMVNGETEIGEEITPPGFLSDLRQQAQATSSSASPLLVRFLESIDGRS